MKAECDGVADVKKLLRPQKARAKPPTGLSTGIDVLNCACSGSPEWGYPRGHYVLLAGDSMSGKTFMLMTAFAEAARDPRFAKYRFLLNNPERGALMDVVKFFGPSVAARLEEPEPSRTVEEFYYQLYDVIRGKRPFIEALDSMDCLDADASAKKFRQKKRAHERDDDAKGSYGTDKARANSANLRTVLGPLQRSNSLLIIVSQLHDRIGFGFEPKARSGGHALRYYAALELWCSVKGKLKKRVKGKDRQVGVLVQVKVKKNRLTGKDRTVEVPLYWSVGVDNVGCSVNYLIEEGHWPDKAGAVTAPEFAFEGSREALVEEIEDQGGEARLRGLVGDVWRGVEEACEVKRKRRYE